MIYPAALHLRDQQLWFLFRRLEYGKLTAGMVRRGMVEFDEPSVFKCVSTTNLLVSNELVVKLRRGLLELAVNIRY